MLHNDKITQYTCIHVPCFNDDAETLNRVNGLLQISKPRVM